MITDRKTHKNKSLIRYLSLNYLLFTGTILLILLGLYGIYSFYARSMAPLMNLEGLYQKALGWSEKREANLNPEGYLGPGAAVYITDLSGRLLYSSDPNHTEDYTPGELACIPRYDSDSRFLAAKLPAGSENGDYLITQARYDNQGNLTIDGYLFLDSDLKVRSGSIKTVRSYFTPEEFQYLGGTDDMGRSILRLKYTNPLGEKRQLIAAFFEPDPGAYEQIYRLWDHIWLLFIPAYLLTAAVFIVLMTKKARSFLNPFNQAVLRVSKGEDSQLEHYRGPEEFTGLARNFVRMEQQLQESRDQREQMAEQRRQLLADISHDLKTPAAVISGCACALKDGLVPPDQRDQYLETIIRKSGQVSRLLSQFHEYNKLELTSLPAHMERKDLCALTREYFADRYQELELKGFQIEADIPETPLYCMADPQLFCRLLDNLVQNSLFHNPDGCRIFVSVQQEDSVLILLLGDDGKGIPESIRQTLFDPFVIGDTARSGDRGSGLGLAIAKKLTELHKGTISLTACDSWSTCFQIRLPSIP